MALHVWVALTDLDTRPAPVNILARFPLPVNRGEQTLQAGRALSQVQPGHPFLMTAGRRPVGASPARLLFFCHGDVSGRWASLRGRYSFLYCTLVVGSSSHCPLPTLVFVLVLYVCLDVGVGRGSVRQTCTAVREWEGARALLQLKAILRLGTEPATTVQ